jgi:hypothetical protein
MSVCWPKLEHLNRLTDPVNVTFLMRGWRQSASLNGGVFSKLVVKTLKTPLGNPARSARFAKARTDSGVSGDGFTIIQQPAAKAAEAFRKIILLQSAIDAHLLNGRTHAIGKFQGTKAAATPIGCLTVKTLLPGAAGVFMVPVILSASPANHQVNPNA